MLGGCATVAGWGNRYNEDDMEDKGSNCIKDFSDMGPDKIA